MHSHRYVTVLNVKKHSGLLSDIYSAKLLSSCVLCQTTCELKIVARLLFKYLRVPEGLS